MLGKEVVIDGRGHLLGRLASLIAKQILSGQKITVVRCELLEISGKLLRNRCKFMQYLRKRHNTNPKRGPYHQRAPSLMLFKVVRGMVPRKTPRGQAALERLKVFDGVPYPYDTKKKMVVPEALRVLRLNPTKKYTQLSELAVRVGWNKRALIERLEGERKKRAEVWYNQKLQRTQQRSEVEERLSQGVLAPVLDEIRKLEY